MKHHTALVAGVADDVDSLLGGDTVQGIVPRTEHQVRARDNVNELLTQAGAEASIQPDVLVLQSSRAK